MIKRILSGHTSPETAYIVDDYPYGFRLRCKIRYWLEEHPKRGTRMVSQTSNPRAIKAPEDTTWNTPKASTYCYLAGAMYLDEKDYVQWSGLNEYSGAEEARQWLNTYVLGLSHTQIKRVTDWIIRKTAYEASRAAGRTMS